MQPGEVRIAVDPRVPTGEVLLIRKGLDEFLELLYCVHVVRSERLMQIELDLDGRWQ